VDYNALDNRKCTICDFVFDQDCDDCPAMPMLIKMWKDRASIEQQDQPDSASDITIPIPVVGKIVFRFGKPTPRRLS
jgi:hypothetical protein